MFPYPVAMARTGEVSRTPSAVDWLPSRTGSYIWFSLLFAVFFTVFEGPIRYALNNLRLDSLIFIRDAFIFAAFAAFTISRLPTKELPMAVVIFFALAAIHGLVSLFNVRSPVPAIYGLKLFVPALCGFLVAECMFKPNKTIRHLILFMWLAAATGALLDKFWLDYPWVGMNVDLGGINVFLGRDWQSGSTERIGGLSRSSINLAVCLPMLSFMALSYLRTGAMRAFICMATLVILVWTTQKGAILAFALSTLAMLLSNRKLMAPLKAAIVLAVIAMVFAPTVLVHFEISGGQGVFSFESLADRARQMWPDAWAWIGRFPMITGVGLGGIGGAQRFYAPDYFNAADNLFVYLFANFGFASVVYLLLVVFAALNMKITSAREDGAALASLCFLMTYGLVISLVEDQLAAIWLGAALGWITSRQHSARRNLQALRVDFAVTTTPSLEPAAASRSIV